MKLAILGASGFLGSRAVEIFHLRRDFEVRPVVRSYGALTRLARFNLDWRIADATDEAALAKAFEGCELVLNCVTGDPESILASTTAVYRAASATRVQRLVFLSTAVVHGQDPRPGVTEASPLVTNERHYNGGYNYAKVRAEEQLQRERAAGSTEVVILRPGIVFGPRSHWVYKPAETLLNGTFGWVNNGAGICNSIYVDNLVEAIRLALTVPGIDREAFLIGDNEIVTWSDLVAPIADALGLAATALVNLPPVAPRVTWRDRLKQLHGTAPVQAAIRAVPRRLKRSIKAGLREYLLPPPAGPWDCSPRPTPHRSVAPEMQLLYGCRYRLPDQKAREKLGYLAPVPFVEGVRRSIHWLEFVGYPIRRLP
jgi:nucleoside-diphosphate-sugar epimerase